MEEIMSKMHIWIGYTTKSKSEFSQYFIINNNLENDKKEEPSFCNDLNITWYDEDLIGIYKSDSNDNLQITLEELPISPDEIKKAYDVCLDLNITKANALFYYADAELVVFDLEKKYNELIYIGCYDWD
ncbi:immunity 22 family protein [Bacteroides acidifaciens]|uniref:immunity 22 family protein n=1 Tax=Bacteroides acidifaciens TaxID=85831 RepID=UPI0030149AF0